MHPFPITFALQVKCSCKLSLLSFSYDFAGLFTYSGDGIWTGRGELCGQDDARG